MTESQNNDFIDRHIMIYKSATFNIKQGNYERWKFLKL